MKKGISLIVLVVTIIIMIILSSAILISLARTNLTTTARYAVFYNDMQTLKEQVSLYTITTLGKYPWSTYIDSESLNKMPSLKEEIAYYRMWKLEGQRPTTNIDADNMILDTPNGATDVYIVDENIDVPKKYERLIYDGQTGILHVYKGTKINAKMVHSIYSASEQNNIYTALIPNFEVPPNASNNEINPGMKFDLITNASTQIFKLYENGDVYGRGLKGSALNTSETEMKKIDVSTWQEFKIPSVIPSPKKVIPGISSIYVIDGNDELWGWANNSHNKLGLTYEQQISFTGREPIKLNVDGKKVKRVFPWTNNTIVITKDNKLYGAGTNSSYSLGLGHNNTVNEFTEINFNKVSMIKDIMMDTHGQTLISCIDETYYFAGPNSFGQLGYGTKGEIYKVFTQIWNSGALDIDQDIKIVLPLAASIQILKKDGTLWQAGYTGYAGGGDITGDSTKLNKLPETYASNVKEIYQIGGARVLVREVNGVKEVWGSPATYNNIGLDEVAYNSFKYHKMNLPTQLTNEGIKEVLSTGNNIVFISNSGNVYAGGPIAYLGLGENKEKATSVIKLPISNIQTAYSDFVQVDRYFGNLNGMFILTGKNGRMYTTGNNNLLHYNKILQNSWTKVTSNVKYFTPGAYIDLNNDLWVSGPDSRTLGLGESKIREIPNYIKVNDNNINGKAEKVQKADELISVKTTDGKLYYAGLYDVNRGAPGWGDTSNRYNFVELLTNVDQNNLGIRSRFAVSFGNLYGWGTVHWAGVLGLPKSVPTRINTDASLENNIKQITNTELNVFVITKSGGLWTAGSHPSSELGMPISEKLVKHSFNFNNKKVIKMVNFSAKFILTDAGNVYGWGIKKYLGIGNTTDEIISSPIKLDISDVEDIIGDSGVVIAKLKNGEVWATGVNNSGVLGKWMRKDGTYSTSDYETAFEWVRCHTLEK